MIIQIKDKEITLKKSMRSYLLYENITDSIFAPRRLSDIITYFYCVVLASEKGIDLTWDEFIDWLDDNDNALNDFKEWLEHVNEVDTKMTPKKKTTAKAKAKKSPTEN